MTTTRHRQSRRMRKGALLSLLPLSCTAFVLPPLPKQQQALTNTASSSTVRKSINFGPHIVADHYTTDKPSPALQLWNAAAPALSIASADLKGTDLARTFGEFSTVSYTPSTMTIRLLTPCSSPASCVYSGIAAPIGRVPLGRQSRVQAHERIPRAFRTANQRYRRRQCQFERQVSGGMNRVRRWRHIRVD